MKLQDLSIGESAKIAGYEKESAGNYRTKLLSLGLTSGVCLRVTHIAPMGDPIEVELRGYRLSLRRSESEILILQSC